jgi:hypothetical protein
MNDLRKAAERALEAFEKIHEGCGCVKEDNLSKESNDLATLVRKDCIPQIKALRQALTPEVTPEVAPEVNEPEGWVKIDEVRQYLDSVGCGTIYKTAGEDRVPLYSAPPKREWVGLTTAEVIRCQEVYYFDTYANIEAKLKEKNVPQP